MSRGRNAESDSEIGSIAIGSRAHFANWKNKTINRNKIAWEFPGRRARSAAVHLFSAMHVNEIVQSDSN
jgi:hypothetical protein